MENGKPTQEVGGSNLEQMKRLNAELPASVHARFKAIAAREHSSMSAIVRRLITEYVNKFSNE